MGKGFEKYFKTDSLWIVELRWRETVLWWWPLPADESIEKINFSDVPQLTELEYYRHQLYSFTVSIQYHHIVSSRHLIRFSFYNVIFCTSPSSTTFETSFDVVSLQYRNVLVVSKACQLRTKHWHCSLHPITHHHPHTSTAIHIHPPPFHNLRTFDWWPIDIFLSGVFLSISTTWEFHDIIDSASNS